MVFAKEPVPGQVKTRLCPPLTGEEAAALAMAFVEDTCALVNRQAYAGDRRVLYSPGGGGPVLARIAADHGFEIAAQEGEDLGARMAAALRAELEGGATSVLLLGSDSPHARPAHVRAAQEILGVGCELVIAPTFDGGYWAIGVRGRVPDVFDDMPWSTADVLPMTLERARDRKLKIALLPFELDVDRIEDLRVLAAYLEHARTLQGADAPGFTYHPFSAPRTHAAIAALRQARPEVFRGDGRA